MTRRVDSTGGGERDSGPINTTQPSAQVEVHHIDLRLSLRERIQRVLRELFGPRISVHEGRKLLQDSFVPHLRGLGFKGTRNTYWKRYGNQISAVNIQPSQWNQAGLDYLFYINLGTAPFPSNPHGAQTMKEYECSRRTRLGRSTTEDWVLSGHQKNDAVTLTLLNERFTSLGLPWLQGKPGGTVLGNIYEMARSRKG